MLFFILRHGATWAKACAGPHEVLGGNIPTLLHLLEGIHTCPVIFSSSCATYGLPQSKTIDETHPQNPVNPYGETKLVGETILKRRARTGGERSVFSGISTLRGPRWSTEKTTGRKHTSSLLAIRAALGQRGKLSVFGGDYDTRDGSCVRDFVHVSDLARAHILALEWIRAGNGSGEWNLGSGIGSSVLEVIRAVETVTESPFPMLWLPVGRVPALDWWPPLKRRGSNWAGAHSSPLWRPSWNPRFSGMSGLPKGYDSLSY